MPVGRISAAQSPNRDEFKTVIFSQAMQSSFYFSGVKISLFGAFGLIRGVLLRVGQRVGWAEFGGCASLIRPTGNLLLRWQKAMADGVLVGGVDAEQEARRRFFVCCVGWAAPAHALSHSPTHTACNPQDHCDMNGTRHW